MSPRKGFDRGGEDDPAACCSPGVGRDATEHHAELPTLYGSTHTAKPAKKMPQIVLPALV